MNGHCDVSEPQDSAKFQQYMIDPQTLYDIPANVDLRTDYILDDSAPRSDLGLGVSAIVLSVGHARNRDMSKKPESLERASAVAAGTTALPAAEPKEPEPAAPSSTRRLLQANSSDDGNDAKATELIAQNCKTAIDEGLWSSPDPLNSNNVAFWMGKYTEHILRDYQSKNLPADE